MGHWTTYRRRGSKPSAADVIPYPATPVLSLTTDVLSATLPAGNTGGRTELWASATEFGSYNLEDDQPTATVNNFGARTNYTGQWLALVNRGDGIHRAFSTPFSNRMQA